MTVQLLQKHDFSEGALGIGCILESIETFLQGDYLSRFLVDGLPHNAIGTSPELLDNLVLSENVTVNVLAHGGALCASTAT
jgi:hypothetical protein